MPYEILTPAPAVNEVHRYLAGQGAADVHADFSVARSGQADIVFLDHRYLLTPNNEALARYRSVMKLSDQEALKSSDYLSYLNPNVAAFEIPRDARTLEQVAVSTDSEAMTNADVYGMLGRIVREAADKASLIPKPDHFELRSTIYSRLENRIVLTPGIEFETFSKETMYELDNAIREQLLPRYKKFGGQAMYGAYLVGKN